MNVMTIGIIATFSRVDTRLFHSLDADKISHAARSPIRLTTVMMLTSETPNVENMLVADDVALKTFRALVALSVLVVLMVLLTVLNIDDNIWFSSYSHAITSANV